MEHQSIENKLKAEMLKEIFIQTGGRDENPKIAEICAKIAAKTLIETNELLFSYITNETLTKGK